MSSFILKGSNCMLDSNCLYVKDENGNEKKMTILFTLIVMKRDVNMLFSKIQI